MGAMTTPEQGHKLSFRITAEDKAALDALVLLVPAMREGRSILLRAALRLGMAELAQNPSKVLTAAPPNIPPPGRSKRK